MFMKIEKLFLNPSYCFGKLLLLQMADQLVRPTPYSGSEFNKLTKDCIFIKLCNKCGPDVPPDTKVLFAEGGRMYYWREQGISFNEITDCARYSYASMRVVSIPDDAIVYVKVRLDVTIFSADKLFLEEKYEIHKHPLFHDQEKCLEIVSKNPMNLQFVANKTTELCKLAVEKNGRALTGVPNKTDDLCKIAIKQDWRNIKYVPSWNQTDENCMLALELANKEPNFSLTEVPINDKEQAQKCWLILLERTNKISKEEMAKMKQAHDNWKKLLTGRTEGIAKL